MTSENRDYEKELRGVLRAIAAQVADSPDDDVAAELARLTQDPDQIAEDVRTWLLNAVEADAPEALQAEDPAGWAQIDPAEFEQLYKMYAPRIFAYILRMVRDPAAAQDLLQEVFIKVFRRFATLRERSKLQAWLYAIAHNQVIEEAKTSRRRPISSGSDVTEIAAAANWRAPELRHDLESAIAALPEKQRAVLTLHDIQGIQDKEIASILGTVPSTVRVHLALARRRVREFLTARAKDV